MSQSRDPERSGAAVRGSTSDGIVGKLGKSR